MKKLSERRTQASIVMARLSESLRVCQRVPDEELLFFAQALFPSIVSATRAELLHMVVMHYANLLSNAALEGLSPEMIAIIEHVRQ